jgi:proteic killer suppression protein
MTSYKAISYSQIVIRSFNDKRAESIFHRRRGKGLPVEIQQRARRKLRMLDAVTVIDDLKIPPSNHLQKLKGDRRGQHSIRINDQWRISFVRQHRWASEIEIVGD